MSIIKRTACFFMTLVLISLATIYLALFNYLYLVKDSGELTLDKVPGVVKITREKDTQILHIKGDSWVSIAYG